MNTNISNSALMIQEATSFQFLHIGEVASMIAEVEQHPLDKAPLTQGKRNVIQHFKTGHVIPEVSPKIMYVIHGLEKILRKELITLPKDFSFNDYIIHQYEYPSALGIGIHHDSVRFKYVIALLILRAGGDFHICRDVHGTKPVLIPAIPGSCILMHAPGLYDCGHAPYHYVSNIQYERLTIGLRFKLQD